MRKFFRITYYAGIGIVFVLVAFVAYTQTRGFRSSLQDYILSHYQSVLNGQLKIGRIEGNLITGIRLYDVSLRNADSTLFRADQIEISHDPLALLFKRISLGNVSIVNPQVKLYRSTTGAWNFSDLLVPSSDTSTAASAWDISVKNVHLINARVSMVDSVLLGERARGLRDSPPSGVIDYARIAIDSLNVEGGLQIKPGETSLQVRRLSFAVEDPGFRLKHLEGDFKLTRNAASATSVRLVTDRSNLRLDASLSRIDITDIRNLAELRTKPVRLDLRAENLDTHELKQFLYPWVDFLDKDLTVEVHADGEFGRLNVRKVVVETPKSMIDLSGTITNLHRPKDLELDILSNKSIIEPDDISAHVPGLFLPELGQLGRSTVRLTFKGAPTDFESTVRAETQAGIVDASAQLKIEDVLEYKAAFTTNNLNLGELSGNSDLTSDLNLNGSISGIGTDVYTASTVARVEVDSSEFWGMPLGKSALVLDLSDAVLRAHTQIHARSTSYDLSSVLRFPRGDSVSYTLNGSVNALNLADIIRNDQFASDLSFTLKAGGRGATVGSLDNAVTLSFLRSSYAEVPFDNAEIGMSLNLSDSERSVFAMRSDPLDIDVEGRFTLPALVENIIDGVQMISQGIAHRLQSLDSLRSSSPSIGTAFHILQGAHPKFVYCTYDLKVRNLFPVGVFFRWNLAGSLAMKGAIKGSVDSLDFQGSTQVQSFEYKSRSDSYTLNTGTLSLDLGHLSRTNLLDNLQVKLNFRGDDFSINKTAFRNTELSFLNQSDSASYQWGALIDSTYQVDVRGTSEFSSNVYEFDLSQIRVGMDFYILENNEPVSMKLGRDGLFVDSLTLTHEVEELGVNGYFDPSGVSDLKFTVNDFLLNNLKSILLRTKVAEAVKDLNGILNATLSLKGQMSDPDLMLDLTANGFRSRDVVFGQVIARSSYANHLLSLFLELRNRQNEQDLKPDFLVSGTVPYVLGSSGENDNTPQGEMNLTLYSKGLNMGFLEPFVPAVSNLTGTLVCDMKIRGNVDAPTYEGNISLQGIRFFFKPLGIYYAVQGKLIPNGKRVGFENFVIRNIPQDRPDGQMKLSGTFSLLGLSLQDFNVRADGQLLVMKESSRLEGQKFYGDLFLGTGPGGLRWDGQLSDSRVTGDVVVKSGRITFPPEHEVTSMANSSINVIFKDDTSKAAESSEGKSQTATGPTESTGPYASLGAFTDYARPAQADNVPSLEGAEKETQSKSFLDNISYDLNIEVQSPTSLLFVFNTQPSEQLFADLKGKLAFLKNTSQTRLTGEMSLESRSYYYFLKRFEASGKIDFTGDPTNPELDVTAKYEGIHTLDTLTTAATPVSERPKTSSGQLLTSERVDVLLQITGTKNKPKTKFSLEFPDRDKNSQYVSKDPDADAMSFLVTGYLKDELDPQQRGSYLTANMLSGLTAGLITGPLTNALKKQIGAIQSVDLQYYGGDWNKTDVRVTAEISSAVIRFGGRVIEGINNTNVSVEVPVGSVFGSDTWRNLLFKYERKVDAVESVDQRTQSNSLSLFYRIVF